MRKIKMQYPLRNNNQNYDGKIHEILIEEMYQIGDKPLYLMNYYDKTLEQSMCTVLLKRNGSFYKMPLVSYDNLGKKVKSYGLNRVTDDVVTPFIQLGNFIEIEKLLNYNYNTNRYMVKLQCATNNSKAMPPKKNTTTVQQNDIKANYKVKANTNILGLSTNELKRKNSRGEILLDLIVCYNYNTKEMTFMGCDIDFKRFKQENLYKFISQKNKYNEFIKNEIEHSLYFTNEKMVTKTTVSFVVNGITYRLNVQRVPYYNNLLDETLSNIESLEITGPSEIISEAGALYSVINNSDSRFKVKNIKYTEGYNSSKQKRK